jgi:hypothetical protein
MMTEQNPKNERKKSILDALGDRGDLSDIPEPTEEQAIQEAMMDMEVENLLEDQYPETPPQVKPLADDARKKVENAIENTLSLPERKVQIIPVSNIAPQPAEETSTRESQENHLQDNNLFSKICEYCGKKLTGAIPRLVCGCIGETHLRRLIEYVNSEMYTSEWVRLHLMNITAIPKMIPSPILWDLPGDKDISWVVYNVAKQAGYIENVWPSLKILMGDSKDNTEWCCGVLTTMALFDAIRLLPYQQQLQKIENKQ